MAPGETSAHLHEFFGNTTTDANSTYESMLGGDTTCSSPKDTAAYWVPTLISPSGEVVRAKNLLVYYRGAEGERTVAFPPDLRMVSDNVRDASPQNLVVKFPSCWDGQNTDSADHISHMAKASGKGCPASHPVRVPGVTMVVRYSVDVAGHTLSSGPLTTLHADFWNTWDQARLEELVASCLNTSTGSCPRIDA